MPAFVFPIEDNQIIVGAVVHSPNMSEPFSGYMGLLDTGAQKTAVSPRLVRELQPAQVDLGLMQVASGEVVEVPIYLMNVGIAIPGQIEAIQDGDELHVTGQVHVAGTSLTVMGLPHEPDGWDILLGMDLLTILHLVLAKDSAILSI